MQVEGNVILGLGDASTKLKVTCVNLNGKGTREVRLQEKDATGKSVADGNKGFLFLVDLDEFAFGFCHAS